jgi:hypothetical protein
VMMVISFIFSFFIHFDSAETAPKIPEAIAAK